MTGVQTCALPIFKYIHPDMEPILKSTYGCMIYQEQLLDIVRKFGGRSYGGADLFRKAIGKKNAELVRQESAKLYQEIIDNGYSEKLAKTISGEMSEKGGYLFNKSHSCGYAVICLQTAYLKAYYPSCFFKALLNLNKDKTGALNKYIIDAKQFNVAVLPPNINKSLTNFTADGNEVLFGLSGIKGIGEIFAEVIIERRENGFKSLRDFIEKVNPSKTQVISLIKSGAIPASDKKKCLIKYLKSFYAPLTFNSVTVLPPYKTLANDWGIDIETYRTGNKKYDYDKASLLNEYNRRKKELFDLKQEERFKKYIDDNKKYIENEDFWEFESLQIFINNNPFDKAYEYLTPFENVDIGDECVIVGVIAKVQKKKDKNKKQFAFINIYSSFGLAEGIVWHSQLKEYEDIVRNRQRLALLVKKDTEERVIIKRLKPYDVWLNHIRRKGAEI